VTPVYKLSESSFIKGRKLYSSMAAPNLASISVEYLVVGPGGAGGGNGRGGGSGGEVRTDTQGLFLSTLYTVTIGAPGTWAGNLGRTGTDTVFGAILSVTSTAGQDAGDPPGGAGRNGGGNGGAFADPSGVAGSNGTSSAISGSSLFYGSGGGGGSGGTTTNAAGGANGGGAGGKTTGNTATRTGTNGTANTGGGGGGSGNHGGGELGNATFGGSGIIILKYPSTRSASFSGGVTQTTSTSGNFKISIITAAGVSDTVSWT